MKLNHCHLGVAVVLSLVLAACGGGGSGTGAAGTPGANGLRSLLAMVVEPAGANCPAGGTRVDSGLDLDGDDVLDAGEVVQAVYVCNGASGADGTTGVPGPGGASGLNSLVTTLAEPAGPRCTTGGTRVQAGVDDNANGTLEAIEVDATAYVCNGAVSLREWSVAANVDAQSTGRSTYPRVGSAADGSVMVAWYRTTSTGHQLWARRYTPANGWGLAVPVSAEINSEGLDTPQLSVDAAGNALLVWTNRDGTVYRVWGNRFTVGSGWGTAATLDDTSGRGFRPRLGANAAGQAALVFYGENSVWATQYLPGTGWQPASQLATIRNGWLDGAATFDGAGTAHVVWSEIDPGTGQELIRTSQAPAGGTWTAGLELDRGLPSTRGRGIALATNATGDMVAAWLLGALRPRAARYSPAAGWEAAMQLDTVSVGTSSPHFPFGVAVDPSGNAMVSWRRATNTGPSVFASRSPAAGGWESPVTVEGSMPQGSWQPGPMAMQADAAGNFVMVWPRGPNSTVWTNRYTPGGGWGEPGMLETASTLAFEPALAIDPTGVVTAVWTLYDERFSTPDSASATSDIRYSRYR